MQGVLKYNLKYLSNGTEIFYELNNNDNTFRDINALEESFCE